MVQLFKRGQWGRGQPRQPRKQQSYLIVICLWGRWFLQYKITKSLSVSIWVHTQNDKQNILDQFGYPLYMYQCSLQSKLDYNINIWVKAENLILTVSDETAPSFGIVKQISVKNLLYVHPVHQHCLSATPTGMGSKAVTWNISWEI